MNAAERRLMPFGLFLAYSISASDANPLSMRQAVVLSR
jgi:hypothetical protein